MINKVKEFLSNASKLSLNKQFYLFAGFAFILVMAIYAVSWVKSPDYTVLFSHISSKDEGEIIRELEVNGITYKLLPSSGGILVERSQLNQARMILAKNGLPKTYEDGYQLLPQTHGIYTSQMNEELIRKRILEENLQKAIATLNGVQSAQVQLALPKHTDFMQQSNRPAASVVVEMSSGALLSAEQARGISHLVASSIPYMNARDVTILDQSGELLTGSQSDSAGLSSDQLKYRQQLEDKLKQQVKSVLGPVVGRKNILVEVSANINFDQIENTTETYLPDRKAVQSEQSDTTTENNAVNAQGIPGALSNQPDTEAKFGYKELNSAGGAVDQARTTHDRKSSKFAVGRSITHTSYSKRKLENLSVAILLNTRKETEQGTDSPKPFTEAEIANLESLAKSAIGFNSARGDQISIINQKFAYQPIAKEPSTFLGILWQQAWLTQLIKGLVFLAGFLIFALYIWRPFYQSLAAKQGGSNNVDVEGKSLNMLPSEGVEVNLQTTESALQIDNNIQQFQNTVLGAKQLMSSSPEAAAAVIKQWLNPKVLDEVLAEGDNKHG